MTQNKKARSMHLVIRTLKAGWHDKDEVMLHAAFQLLVDFVEQEQPDKHIDWSHDNDHVQAWKELRALCRWWTKTRPSRRNPLDNKKIAKPPLRFENIAGTTLSRLVTPDKKKYAAYHLALKQHIRLEQKWREEDQRNLHRLVETREFVWT
ncbi:hypothetical protein [Candidatus Methylomirabilis sp.]|uniref:hypothetical protein n=1 Tax=Candidatus Methylomirabilis sp. TaxID=2032687 RepID=UPI003C71431A